MLTYVYEFPVKGCRSVLFRQIPVNFTDVLFCGFQAVVIVFY
ncbi:hypothetical protein CZ787_17225 [Halomonas citrativorans]|uniref:Uncharacterized protein n=1 Tax=Halomonas citrativorans TaxID=2742612 RepID=A0A1R4I6A0_9GAMM|nr:hypothetical protein CZ787_17225 [Halomonas citrativorans]